MKPENNDETNKMKNLFIARLSEEDTVETFPVLAKDKEEAEIYIRKYFELEPYEYKYVEVLTMETWVNLYNITHKSQTESFYSRKIPHNFFLS
ncbi:MAG: hypothetical protein ACOC56_02700 [Atribacterota bacterium]